MHENLDSLTERFDKSWLVLMQNLGPQLIIKAQFALTPGQVYMMHLIRKEEHCSVSKLSEKMEVAPSAITVMLDRLENHGFVSRTRDKEDRRVVIIELTDTGERQLEYVLSKRKQVIQHCFSQLNPDELYSFIQSLEKISSIAQTMDIKTIINIPHQEG